MVSGPVLRPKTRSPILSKKITERSEVIFYR
jgi:hypothetical protein